MVIVTGLPNLQDAPTEADFTRYAQETWVSADWLKTEPPSARSFCGVPVEVNGRLWGVIVLDSRGDNAIKRRSVNLYYRLVAPFLGKLLERL
jgi:transcriptional regulator with GAF, ATPase, and Fis domain